MNEWRRIIITIHSFIHSFRRRRRRRKLSFLLNYLVCSNLDWERLKRELEYEISLVREYHFDPSQLSVLSLPLISVSPTKIGLNFSFSINKTDQSNSNFNPKPWPLNGAGRIKLTRARLSLSKSAPSEIDHLDYFLFYLILSSHFIYFPILENRSQQVNAHLNASDHDNNNNRN